MKKTTILFVILASLLCFTSCEEKNKMLGYWELSGIYINGVNLYNSALFDNPQLVCAKHTQLQFSEGYEVYIHACDTVASLGTYNYLDGQCCISTAEDTNGNTENLCASPDGGEVIFSAPQEMLDAMNAFMEDAGSPLSTPGLPTVGDITSLKFKFKKLEEE